jgi:hypothetical protein
VPETPSPVESLNELRHLLVAYAKQETIGPLETLPRYLGRGLAGAVCVGIGLLLLALSALRALQSETGTTFTGNWSWVPYLIVLVGLAGAIALLASFISRSRSAR